MSEASGLAPASDRSASAGTGEMAQVHGGGMSRRGLIRVVERATSLYERMEASFHTCGKSAEGHERIEGWAQRLSPTNPQEFISRLKRDRLTWAKVESLASGGHLSTCDVIPDWAECLRSVVDKASRVQTRTLQDLQDRFAFLSTADGFKHVMVPFVVYGTERVQARARDVYSLLQPNAITDLQSELVHSLCDFARETLALEFAKAGCVADQVHSPWGKQTHELGTCGSGDRNLYSDFVAEMWKGGLQRLLSDYPVLGRLLSTTTEFWISSASNFLGRLRADLPDLAANFPWARIPSTVAHITTGLSDRHNRGRTVLALRFDTGLELVYKHGSPSLQQAYNEVLRWLNRNGSPLPLRVCRTVYRDEYYWVETIPWLPCKSPEEVARYYRRAGMLVCLMYFLGGHDFHAENLIASGEHPVIVDTETLLYCDLDVAAGFHCDSRSDTALRTCMLPRRHADQTTKDYQCGLAHRYTPEANQEVVQWEHVNTDKMRLVRRQVLCRRLTNEVWLHDQFIPADDHIAEIQDGFREMYRLLARSKNELLAKDGPIAPMAKLHPRLIFRDTEVYRKVMRDMLRPNFLREGCDASIRFDILSQPLLSPDAEYLWPLLRAEHDALLRGDIPLFFQSAATGALQVQPDREISTRQGPQASGFEMMCTRFAYMSDDHCEQQIEHIRKSYED